MSETEGERSRQPKGGRKSRWRELEGECAHAKMKDNAINKIYKITNNALGISLIVAQPYYAERRFIKPGHFGSSHWNSGKGERR